MPHAAKAATATIPIVFVVGSRSGQNWPGRQPQPAGRQHHGRRLYQRCALAAKRLGLLHELVPTASVVAVLRDPNNPEFEAELRDLEEAGRAIGRQILMVNAAREREFNAAFATIVASRRRRAAHRRQPILPQPTPATRGAGGRHALPTIYQSARVR